MKHRLKGFGVAALLAALAVSVAAVAWGSGQQEFDCPTCGGSSNVYCCTCTNCSGHRDLCTFCTTGTSGTHCKWITGQGCCIYHTAEISYRNVDNPPQPCPCAAAGGGCGNLVVDVDSAYWYSTFACINDQGVQGDPSTQYDSPPYLCKPVQSPGG